MRHLHASIASATALALLLTGCSNAANNTIEVPPAVETDPADGSTQEPGEPADIVDDESIVVLAQYDLAADDSLIGDVDPAHLAVWERFASIFPPETRPEVVQFVAIDAVASNGTDGAMQVSALNESEYYLAMDTTGDTSGSELDRTMIHEFGHLLSLRPSQYPRGTEDSDCDSLTSDGLCPVADAYLAAWADAYWPGVTEDDIAAEDDTEEDEVFERFDSSPDTYVTEYAATNQGEDFAEVFAEWVIREAAPEGDTTVADKYAFFNDYPELVDMRDHIRSVLFA